MATVLSLTASPATQLIQDAEQCLQQGGVLAVPTDSFYALAVNPFHQAALERLVAMKGERNHKPFPVLIGEVTQIKRDVNRARKHISRGRPGPEPPDRQEGGIVG